jgi:hypothetical protein
MSVPRGFQQIASATLASSTALTLPTNVDGRKVEFAIAHVDTQAVRWRDDGTAPTAAIGMRLLPGGELFIEGAMLDSIRFIYETSGANLNVSYYRYA